MLVRCNLPSLSVVYIVICVELCPAVFLDLPIPWEAVESAKCALKVYNGPYITLSSHSHHILIVCVRVSIPRQQVASFAPSLRA